MAHMGAPGAPESSKSSFSPPRRPSRDHFGPILDSFGDAILLCAGCCLCACALAFVFCARVFFKASIVNLRSSNPQSLKPWVAAGGREAIRIKKNVPPGRAAGAVQPPTREPSKAQPQPVWGSVLPFEDYYPSPKSPLRPSKGHYVGGLPPRFHGSAGAALALTVTRIPLVVFLDYSQIFKNSR